MCNNLVEGLTHFFLMLIIFSIGSLYRSYLPDPPPQQHHTKTDNVLPFVPHIPLCQICMFRLARLNLNSKSIIKVWWFEINHHIVEPILYKLMAEVSIESAAIYRAMTIEKTQKAWVKISNDNSKCEKKLPWKLMGLYAYSCLYKWNFIVLFY